MKKFVKLFACLSFLLVNNINWAGDVMKVELTAILARIPDLSAQALQSLPSVNLGFDDSRIENLSQITSDPYMVTVFKEKVPYVVITNPRKKVGYLWWRKSKKIIVSEERYLELKNPSTIPLESEIEFFKELQKE